MKSAIISIGDELISGKTINSNAAWMGGQLFLIGVPVLRVTTIGDDVEMILSSLQQAEQEVEAILITGGLGPTHDDITRTAICRYLDCGLTRNEAVLEQIHRLFRHRGLPLVSSNESQAMVPDKVDVLANERGTAPGYHFKRNGRDFFVMPGVPHEMKGMMTSLILPELRSRHTGPCFESKIFCTTGIAESILFEKIGDPSAVERYAKMAFLPGPAGVQIRLVAAGNSAADASTRLTQAGAIILEKAGRYIYADHETTLEQILAELLWQQRATVAVAESCTGGLIAHKLTNVSGSSAFFERGLICYSNRAKTELLGVPAHLIETEGAVSEAVAIAMAEGVRRIAQSDYGLATTGIAGPAGGSEEKPVGLIYLALADRNGARCERHVFSGDRWLNKERFSNSALNLLRKKLVEK